MWIRVKSIFLILVEKSRSEGGQRLTIISYSSIFIALDHLSKCFFDDQDRDKWVFFSRLERGGLSLRTTGKGYALFL